MKVRHLLRRLKERVAAAPAIEGSSDWPNDADGGVFRSLQASNFPFARPHTVDYNVDFDSWPPAKPALAALESRFGAISIHDPDDDSAGYVQFHEYGLVSYFRVVEVQRLVSEEMAQYGGICESWGVLQSPPH